MEVDDIECFFLQDEDITDFSHEIWCQTYKSQEFYEKIEEIKLDLNLIILENVSEVILNN